MKKKCCEFLLDAALLVANVDGVMVHHGVMSMVLRMLVFH